MTRAKTCADCGKEPSEGWPDEDSKEGELCQMCWEAQCDKSWWQMYDALGQAGLLEDEE